MNSSTATRPGPLLAVLLVGPFMAQADATIANVATPSIHADLGASGATLELVISGYLIAFAVLLITGARLGQTHGYRRMYLVGATVFTGSSLLCGVAPDAPLLVVARVLQGLGAALMFPQTLTGISLNFAGDARRRAIGLYAAALSGGAVTGQILGGVLISADLGGSPWRAIFLVNVPIGAVLVVSARRYLPGDAPRTPHRLDVSGVLALSVAVLLLVVPLALGRSAGWPTWAWVSLAAAVPAVIGFIAFERRIADRDGAPLVNVRILARPAVSWTLLTLVIATGTYYSLLFTLAQYLQDGVGDSPLLSGLTLVPWVAAFGAAGQIVHRLPARAASAAPIVGCLLLASAYAAISALLLGGRHDEPVLLALLAVGGLGLGLQFSALITRLITVVPPEYAPDISGVSTTTTQLGGAVGVAAFGTLYLGLAGHGGSVHATHAFAMTTAAFAVLALIAAVAAGRSTRNPVDDSPDSEELPSGRAGITPASDASRRSPRSSSSRPSRGTADRAVGPARPVARAGRATGGRYTP